MEKLQLKERNEDSLSEFWPEIPQDFCEFWLDSLGRTSYSPAYLLYSLFEYSSIYSSHFEDKGERKVSDLLYQNTEAFGSTQ